MKKGRYRLLKNILEKSKEKRPTVRLPNSAPSAAPLPRPPAQVTLIPPSKSVPSKAPVKAAPLKNTLFDVGEDYSKDKGFLDKVQSVAEDVEGWASDIGFTAGLAQLQAKELAKVAPRAAPVVGGVAGKIASGAINVAKPLQTGLYVLDAGRGLADERYREGQYANMDRLVTDDDRLAIAAQLAQRPTTASAGLLQTVLNARHDLQKAEAETAYVDALERTAARNRIRNLNKLLQRRRDRVDPNWRDRSPSTPTVGRPEDY